MTTRLGTLARVAALMVGLGVPALVATTTHRQYALERAEAETRAGNTARALEQHAARTFETIDTYLRAVASLVGPHAGDLPLGAVHAALREQFLRSRLNNIMVIDRDGRALVEADAFPARPLDVRDRDYFKALRDRPAAGLVVGRPLTGRLTGKTLIPVARRIDGPDGAFAGIVQAMLDPKTFEAVYEGIDNGPGATLNLWRSDGTLLVRTPPLPEAVGRNFSGSANYRQHVPFRDTRPFWSAALSDGVERVIALSYLDGYPLYVGAALSRDDVLADWRRSAIVQASLAGGLTLVLVSALLLLAREIERRQGADARIRASEERYRLLAENTSDLIVLKPTMTGQRGYVSPAVRAILGWDPDEYAALPSAAIIHPDEMAGVAAVYGALCPDRPQATHVHRLRHRAGHYVWIESVFRLVGRDPDARTVVVSGRDVTERMEADRALRESEARLRLVSEAATDMVTHMDLTGRRLYVSPASRDLIGYEPDELTGTTPREAVHPDDAAGLDALLADLRAGRREHGVSVNRLRHRDGRWVWVEASLKRLDDGTGRTVGFVASVRDAEARKADEAALLAAREDAERASAAKSEFLAAMSHEIRTPLNGVVGYADLLCDEADLGPRARRHAERIRSAGAALLTVVNDVLDFSKIEAGRVEIEPRPFAPVALIDNAASIVRGLAEAKGLALEAVLDPGLPGWLTGDEDRLRQVLLNLLNNAVKFTARGRIELRVEAVALRADVDAGSARGRALDRGPGGENDRDAIGHGSGAAEAGAVRLRCSVRDSGIGIPADKLDRLFRRFSQVDGSISRDFGGTGLGLAISKALIEQMGGAIGVESEAGRGSTFWFTLDLPVVADPDAAAEPPPAPGACTGRRLLLAEDVPLNQDLARAILERAGHVVDVVGDGAAAVAAVQARAYDLVLMDVQMPGMDGLSATRRIRALGGAAGRVPIVALTANVLPEQIAGFRAAGMDDHVGKPFRQAALLAAVERWASGGPGGAPHDTVDRAVLDEMTEMVGHERMVGLLTMLADDLARRFGPASPASGREQVAGDAHAMVSATSMVGFAALSDLCRAVEAACRSEDDYEPLLSSLRARSVETIAEIAMLSSGLS